MALGDTFVRLVITARDRTRGAFTAVEGRVGRLRSLVGSIDFGRLFGIGAAGSIAAGAVALKKFADQADRLSKTARTIGTTTEALSALEYVAERNGVSAQQLSKGLLTMTRRIADAAQGTGEAKDALEQLGLSAERLVGLSVDEQYLAIADAMQGVARQADRVAIGADLFDKRNAQLVITMEQGAAGVQELMDRAEELGLVMETDAAEAAERFNDSLTDLKGTLIGLRNDALPGVIDGINQFLAVTGRSSDEQERLLARMARIRAAIRKQDQLIEANRQHTNQAYLDQLRADRDSLQLLLDQTEARRKAVAERKRDNEDRQREINEHARAEQSAADQVADAQDRVTKALKQSLAERKAAYADYVSAVKTAQDQERAVLNEFAQLVEDIASPGGGQAAPDFLDVSRTKQQAEAALNSGDTQQAIELSRKAGEQLRQLKEEGEGSSLALVGLAKQIQAVATAAARQDTASAIVDRDKVKAQIDQIKADLATLEATEITFTIDEHKVILSAQNMLRALQEELAKSPLVVQTILAQPGGGAAAFEMGVNQAVHREAQRRGGR